MAGKKCGSNPATKAPGNQIKAINSDKGQDQRLKPMKKNSTPKSKLGMIAAAMLLFSVPALAGGTFQYTSTPTPMTGNESLPLDTNLTQGIQPQTASATMDVLSSYFAGRPDTFRNALIGGDANTNPWQRGTTAPQLGNITSTLLYTADRFWAQGGASSGISVTRQSTTGLTDSPYAFRFQRVNANADTTAICFGQTVESMASVRFRGAKPVLSFSAAAGGGFSATGGLISVTIAYGTGTDEAASNFNAGTWTGQANSVNTTQSISSTWTRYSFAPAAVLPTTVNEIGIKLCYTPVGTASTTDYVDLANIQLEVNNAGVASVFERRAPGTELQLAQRYTFVLNEGSIANGILAMGLVGATNTETVVVPFPTTLRGSTVATSIKSAGNLKLLIAGTATAITSFQPGASTPVAGALTAGTTATAGQATLLQAGSPVGGGKIYFEGEL